MERNRDGSGDGRMLPQSFAPLCGKLPWSGGGRSPDHFRLQLWNWSRISVFVLRLSNLAHFARDLPDKCLMAPVRPTALFRKVELFTDGISH